MRFVFFFVCVLQVFHFELESLSMNWTLAMATFKTTRAMLTLAKKADIIMISQTDKN